MSLKALEYALPLAKKLKSKLILLHIVEPVATPDFAYFPLALDDDAAKKAATSKMEGLCKKFKIPASLVDRILVRVGVPFHEITEAARSLKVGMIVLTTHGFTGLKHVLMGSTAERVVRHARCPVLSVRDS